MNINNKKIFIIFYSQPTLQQTRYTVTHVIENWSNASIIG